MKTNPTEYNKKIGNILRNYRKTAGYTCADVAEKLAEYGFSCKTAAVNSWENGRTSIGGLQLLLLCQIYNIRDIYSVFLGDNTDTLLNKEGQAKLDDYRNLLIASGLYQEKAVQNNVVDFPKYKIQVPIYLMAVSAGTGNFLDDDNHDMVDIPEKLPKGVTTNDIDYAVHIHGDSMQPKFEDQQIIWVKNCSELNEGNIGIFYLNGDAYCKKIHKTKKGISLISLNQTYKPIIIKETDEFRILGRVLM